MVKSTCLVNSSPEATSTGWPEKTRLQEAVAQPVAQTAADHAEQFRADDGAGFTEQCPADLP